MRRTRGRGIEVDTVADFDRRLATGASRMSGWQLHDLDLTHRSDDLRQVSVAGALFLGCRFAPGDEEWVQDHGAVVFPTVPGVPVDTYRTTLYTAEELYGDRGADQPIAYAASFDARAYAWSRQPLSRDRALAQVLHDHTIDQALAAWVSQRSLVGVMGGHGVKRGETAYRDAARLGRALGQRWTVATGGGPGAMEAANLGAYLGAESSTALDDALTILTRVPAYRPSVSAWAEAAFAVCERWPTGRDSLGIPTWHYGHEPPNVFATAIAKYFRNATREAILLEVCDAGIVFLPGAAGTLQEIFQDACENYYADESSLAPMVLLGSRYWTEELPAWPLLRQLAESTPLAGRIHLADTVEETVAALAR